MALWDSENTIGSFDQKDKIDHRCPRCGTNVYHDEILDKLVCRHCGGAFDKDTRELSYSFDLRDNEEPGLPEKKLREYMCKTCGTAVVTHETTAPKHCAFCGGEDLNKQELTRQFRPDAYIPFKISREEAIQSFKEFAAGKKEVPKSFNTEATLSKVTGIFVPFWLIDTDNHLKIKAGATRINGENEGKRFDIEVEHDYKLTGIPFDGGKGVDDTLMEAIEPYDYKELKPFDPICLKDYLAERFDIKPLDMTERIFKRLYIYSNQAPSYICKDYQDIDVKKNDSSVNDIRQRYVLLPMWYLTYEYDGIKYSFAVNGQTGEVDGEMPVAKERGKRKQRIVKLLMAAPFILLLLWMLSIVIFHGDELFNTFEFIRKYGFFILLLLAYPFFYCGTRMWYHPEEAKELRRGVKERIAEGLDNLPDVADKVIANAGNTTLERHMDDAPDIGTYMDKTSNTQPRISEMQLTAKTYVDSKRDAR